MSNPYGWGQNEPQIKPKDQGGDTIATFSQKIYNLFDNLFNTLNSYPWSTATQNDAGYMSAADKSALDDVPTTYLPLSGGTMTGVIKSISSAALAKTDNTSAITVTGGKDTGATSGAKVVLYGADNANSGWFNVQAGNSGGYKQLIGKPDGTLTWDGNTIPVVESGTFTPEFYGGTVAGSFTYTTRAGNYLKINKLCFVDFAIDAKVVTVPTGYIGINGFPFAASTANQSILMNLGFSTTGKATLPPVWLRVGLNPNINILEGINLTNGTISNVGFGPLTVGDSLALRMSGIYRTA